MFTQDTVFIIVYIIFFTLGNHGIGYYIEEDNYIRAVTLIGINVLLAAIIISNFAYSIGAPSC